MFGNFVYFSLFLFIYLFRFYGLLICQGQGTWYSTLTLTFYSLSFDGYPKIGIISTLTHCHSHYVFIRKLNIFAEKKLNAIFIKWKKQFLGSLALHSYSLVCLASCVSVWLLRNTECIYRRWWESNKHIIQMPSSFINVINIDG